VRRRRIGRGLTPAGRRGKTRRKCTAPTAGQAQTVAPPPRPREGTVPAPTPVATSETLRKEYYLFTTKQGSYVDTNDGDPDGVFRKFVERVESIVEAENISTLQVMTRETQERTAPSNVPLADASRQTATPKGDVSDA
jgi:hypothetical protein